MKFHRNRGLYLAMRFATRGIANLRWTKIKRAVRNDAHGIEQFAANKFILTIPCAAGIS